MSEQTSHEPGAVRILPVFPLEGTVLFPCTKLALQIFEPRYRTMIRDVTRGEGLIVVSLESNGRLSRLGTVGRIRELETLEDGQLNLRLEGLERVSLTELPGDAPYHQVQIDPRPERLGADSSSQLTEARLELLASYVNLHRMLVPGEGCIVSQDLSFEYAVNMACAALPIDAPLRQRLLDEDSLMERQRQTMDHISKVVETLNWLRASKGSDNATLMN